MGHVWNTPHRHSGGYWFKPSAANQFYGLLAGFGGDLTMAGSMKV